jgi:predicted MFS family arabinose efflux permease
MTDQRVPATLVLSLLFAAIFLTFTGFGMLAPLLVELAAEFQTSVAVTGQLAAATSIAWPIAAPLVGPWSDHLR